MKKELLSRKESKLGDFIAKKKKKREREKACSEQNTKSVAEQPLHKEILGVTTELISSQGKPGDGIAPAEMLLV